MRKILKRAGIVLAVLAFLGVAAAVLIGPNYRLLFSAHSGDYAGDASVKVRPGDGSPVRYDGSVRKQFKPSWHE